MPLVHVYMLEGRSQEQKRQLAEQMTRLMVEVIGAARERVNVVIHESSSSSWAVGGRLLSDEKRES